MAKYREFYEEWLNSGKLTETEQAELLAIKDDDAELEDRFFAPLEFGTAGLRGKMGMGVNRMNVYVVRQTTQALAALVLEEGENACRAGVAVCYDCRHNSELFAREAACVLAANGVNVLLFDAMRPTPELSFAIREYGCTAGINITASHNPKEYNGYKVYWNDGAQLPPEHAAKVSEESARIGAFGAKTTDYDEAVGRGLIKLLGDETDESFLNCVLCCSINPEAVAAQAEKLKIVYTPFHGTGYKLVPDVLRRLGMKHVLCEPEQMKPDGSFPTVASPNPENPEGFKAAIELARANDVDLIIGTDPDADRVGIVVRDTKKDYVTMTGNQVGALLLDYIIRAKKERGRLPKRPAAIKSLVTTELARVVAEEQGVEMFDTFTGFKFMAELIKQMEDEHSYSYLLAYEESYGYLCGEHARDKDAVTASMLIVEMAAWYASKNMTLYDALEGLFKRYGRYAEKTVNLVFPGVSGLDTMKSLMSRLRSDPPAEIAGHEVTAMRDYLVGERYEMEDNKIEKLPIKGSNMLYFELEDSTRLIVRPSGTEPKLKVYVLARGDSRYECTHKLEIYTEFAENLAKCLK